VLLALAHESLGATADHASGRLGPVTYCPRISAQLAYAWPRPQPRPASAPTRHHAGHRHSV